MVNPQIQRPAVTGVNQFDSREASEAHDFGLVQGKMKENHLDGAHGSSEIYRCTKGRHLVALIR